MKKKWVPIIISCGLLLLAGCASTSDQFEAYVQNGDYSKAIEAYTTEIQGNAAMELDADEFLSTYLDDQWKKYLAEELGSNEFDVTVATYQRLAEAIPIADFESIQQEYATVEQARATYAEGMDALEKEDYVSAISTLTEIPETPDNTYAEAQEQLEQAKSAYCDEILDIANDSVDSGDYDAAISVVQEAVNLVGSTDTFTTFLKETYTEKYESEIAQAAEASDFAKVLNLYKEATGNSYVTVSSTMTSTYATSIDQYRQSIINQSIDTYKESGFAEANAIINEGLTLISGDEILSELSQLYSSCALVSLTNIETLDTSMWWNDEEAVVSNIYDDSIEASYYVLHGGRQYSTFFLGKNYTNLDISYLTTTNSGDYQVVIEGDGLELYNSGLIDWEKGKQSVSIDVSGINQLTISTIQERTIGYIYIGDDHLYKVLTDEDFAEFL